MTGTHPGGLFTIQCKALPQPAIPIGPISGFSPSLPIKPVPKRPASPSPRHHHAPHSVIVANSSSHTIPPQTPLLPSLSAVHHLLNSSDPALGRDCWLCLSPKSPYYVGVGSLIPPNITSNTTTEPSACSLSTHLTQVTFRVQGVVSYLAIST